MAIRQSTIERFESKIERIPECGCWFFNGGEDKDGYSHFSYMNVSRPAHRISWLIFCGEIPDGISVLHRCDVRCCVNPSHLFLGTQHDNCLDAVMKDRNVKGVTHGMHKLNVEDVKYIRTFADTWASAVLLATKFNHTPENMQMILKRKTWKHV